MNVLCDFIGHADLFYSMHALFVQRLGYHLYRPYGDGWAQYGIKTAATHCCTPTVNADNVYEMAINTHGYTQHGIDLHTFENMHWDLIVCTSWENERALHRLHSQTPGSSFVRHIANIGEAPIMDGSVNVLLSTLTEMPDKVNYIKYCPEHLSSYCPPDQPTLNFKIKSFTNNLRSYPRDIEMWEHLKAAMPRYSFSMHGYNGDDGCIDQAQLPACMQDAMFIWHVKGNGCCGYVAREALACGKPLIVNKAYCRIHDTLARNYLQDGVNCIDLDPKVRPLEQAMKIIRDWSVPSVYNVKAQQARKTITDTINFQREAQAIERWLDTIYQGVT